MFKIFYGSFKALLIEEEAASRQISKRNGGNINGAIEMFQRLLSVRLCGVSDAQPQMGKGDIRRQFHGLLAIFDRVIRSAGERIDEAPVGVRGSEPGSLFDGL